MVDYGSITGLLAADDVTGQVGVLLLIGAVVFILPFVLGVVIARALKLKDMSVRIGVVLCAAFLGLTPFVAEEIRGRMEQAEYEESLAEWEARQQKIQGKLTPEGIDALQEKLPEVVITR